MPTKTPIKPKKAIKKPVRKAVPIARVSWTGRLIKSKYFTYGYAVIALAILLATTIFWALLGAHLQNENADQSVNSYLFEDSKTLHGAQFPGQHSFLFKWPLFLLLRAVGYSSAGFTAITALIVLLTVVCFAYILYRIERRPLVFGTICLGLASVLLLIPPQPYAGGLLPVNIAMLTTRNLEYLLYLTSLILIARIVRLRSWRFLLAIGVLALLIASDKLFLTLSLGGALISMASYIVMRRWAMAGVASNWLLATLAAIALALGSIWLINLSSLTHIITQGGAGPYGLVHNVHDAALGIIYAVLGIFTNLGANPAFDALTIKGIGHAASQRLLSPIGFAFVVNALLFLAALGYGVRMLFKSLRAPKTQPNIIDAPLKLAIMLIWTSLIAVGVFVLSNHYYAVDARYLTIVLFSIFVVIAVHSRTKMWKPATMLVMGAIFLASIVAGLSFTKTTYHADKAALASINGRDSIIAQALSRHPVQVLVGDYWRVLPIKLASAKNLTVMPLGACSTPRTVLTSSAWQPDLHTHGFAYLLSLDKSLTDYPQCTLDKVTAAYGRPNASAVITGTIEKPTELLLFYDHGIHMGPYKTMPTAQGSGTVAPISLSQLPHTTCTGSTVMNIVAHQDDDLLFMNPDLYHAIQAGSCIRTLYLTAGDAGGGKFYWLGREQGSEAAYSQMIGKRDTWIQRTVKLADRQFVTIANPIGNSKITLMFMHLPDGNTNGSGFAASRYESLARLENGLISQVQSVDGQSNYTHDQLVTAISKLMVAYQPNFIRTQSSYEIKTYADHSDHMASGRLAKQAFSQIKAKFTEQPQITYYIGYPIYTMPINLTSDETNTKTDIFFQYARFDGAVCHDIKDCEQHYTYGHYLQRQYQYQY